MAGKNTAVLGNRRCFHHNGPLVLTLKNELPRYRAHTNRACSNTKKLLPKHLLRKAIARK